MLKDARDDARLGDSANDLAGAAAPRAPAQVDGKYPMQSGHPAHWRGAHTGLGLIVGSRFARLLGARHDARSLARIGRSRTSLCFAPPAHPCALGANRPWYLTRCALGRGASAASRAMTCTDALMSRAQDAQERLKSSGSNRPLSASCLPRHSYIPVQHTGWCRQ